MVSLSGGPARGSAIRTFLIADVRGYTRFTAQQGDEAASRLATRFAEVAGEGIEAWGGELVELRGDEALAVFDSARQALRAAIELQSAFADETRVDPGLPLGVGIGLDAGEAVPVGDGYRGAALNFAARLCAIAAAGEVLASEGLVHLAGRVDGLEFTTLEPTTFKGFDAPVAAVKVSTRGHDGSVAATVTGSPRAAARALPPPLPPELDPIVPISGRDQELRWLRWHWRRARHGHGRIVVLSAKEPGCHAYPQTPSPFWASVVQWSPDGTMIAARDGGNGEYLIVWDAHGGKMLFKRPIVDGQNVGQVIFMPDSKGLVLSFDTGLVETLSTATWTPVQQTQLDPSVFGVNSLGFIGFTPDGSTILAVGGFVAGGNASLFWLDAATLQIKSAPAPVEDAHTGSPKSMALSPDGSLMATGASDGILRVWDARTGELKQQMDFGGAQVQGIAFIDDKHLAVTPGADGLLIMTVDPVELADTVRASLTRTFTATECKTYGIDPCPTLAEMRAP